MAKHVTLDILKAEAIGEGQKKQALEMLLEKACSAMMEIKECIEHLALEHFTLLLQLDGRNRKKILMGFPDLLQTLVKGLI